MEHLESQVMFESRAFRRMVAPHLPVQRAGLAPFDGRDDEGWEAMAMREELTDMMLNSAFGEAIASEVREIFLGFLWGFFKSGGFFPFFMVGWEKTFLICVAFEPPKNSIIAEWQQALLAVLLQACVGC